MAKETTPARSDGRKSDELRPVAITPGFIRSADGSCLIEAGETRIICTASIRNETPGWREDGLGWVTAEYAMLPASTGQRKPRGGNGRSTEIKRLIGRVLRNIVRFDKMPGITIYLDCDVIQADGGTRTTAITGAYVALEAALERAVDRGAADRGALAGMVAAVSVGIVRGRCLLDLTYEEDAGAEVDMNIAMTSAGEFVELQGTSEGAPFTGSQLEEMLILGRKGIQCLHDIQEQAVRQS